MEKKKSIIIIALISLLSVLLTIFAIISFTPKNAVTGYAGFAKAIDKGIDFEGGISATYTPVQEADVSDEDFKSALDTTIEKIKSLIEQRDLEGAKVFLTSNNKIRIEAKKTTNAENLLSQIGAGELKIRTSSSSSDEVRIYGKNINRAFATQSSETYYWGTYIGLDDEGTKALKEVTKNATSSSQVYLYFYRGDSTEYFYRVPTSSQIDTLFVSSSNGSMSQENAIDFAIQVLTGSFDAVLETDGKVETISSQMGTNSYLGLIIASSVSAFLILVIFAIVYRELGLMTIVSLLAYIGLALFFMQAIPGISLTVPTLGAIFLGLVLISACHFVLLEKIREEFKKGKKLSTAIKTGYKNSIMLILEICGVIAILSTVSYFILTDVMKGFALIMIVCSLLSLATTLGITCLLNRSYSVLNSTNGKRVNFLREENADEIE